MTTAHTLVTELAKSGADDEVIMSIAAMDSPGDVENNRTRE